MCVCIYICINGILLDEPEHHRDIIGIDVYSHRVIYDGRFSLSIVAQLMVRLTTPDW